MKFEKQKNTGGAGPSSAIGLIRFFDTEVGGPKMTPEFVLVIALFFIIAMLLFHFIS